MFHFCDVDKAISVIANYNVAYTVDAAADDYDDVVDGVMKLMFCLS